MIMSVEFLRKRGKGVRGAAGVVLGFSILVAAVAWMTVSPAARADFTKLCDSNGGASCMKNFWNYEGYYQGLFYLAVGAAAASAAVAVLTKS